LTIPGKSTPFDATIPNRRSARWDRSKRRAVKLMALMRMAFLRNWVPVADWPSLTLQAATAGARLRGPEFRVPARS